MLEFVKEVLGKRLPNREKFEFVQSDLHQLHWVAGMSDSAENGLVVYIVSQELAKVRQLLLRSVNYI